MLVGKSILWSLAHARGLTLPSGFDIVFIVSVDINALARKRLRIAERLGLRMSRRFRNVCRQKISEFYKLDTTPDRLARILNFRGVFLRHRLRMEAVVDMLLEKYPQRRKGWLPIRTLTGASALEYLDQRIQSQYPHQEHIQSWRTRQRLKFSGNSPERLPLSPEEVSHYLVSISSGRLRLKQESKLRGLRNYRGNPWTDAEVTRLRVSNR